MKRWGLFAGVLALALALWLRPPAPAPRHSVLMIGWDGSRLEQIEKLLNAGELPNLKKLVDAGTFVRVKIRDGRTDTKAGWTQIFTGYDAQVTGVHGNRDYRPIPPGLTAFERLKARYGSKIATAFISGKVNNIGARGPHRVCINCQSRFEDTNKKTKWWDEASDAPPKNGEVKKFEEKLGEPWLNALVAIDDYKNGLGAGENVLAKALEVLQRQQKQSFFTFVHFEEPDEQGHLFKEGSAEYVNAVKKVDGWTGKLLEAVSNRDDVKVFILSDHGFNKGENNHRDAPDTFWAGGIRGMRGDADRRDFTPTILHLYDFPLDRIEPALNGRPLTP